jgi:glycosyltransferase involved in cell wall biosynthesis
VDGGAIVRLIHIAYAKRSNGHLGGVPKFGAYLERHLGAHNLAWSDHPCAALFEDHPEQEKAVLLGASLVGRGAILPTDTIIADGFWANGLREDWNTTVVCHGTWVEYVATGRCAPCPEFVAAQRTAYELFPVVAVSEGAARQCREHYGVEPAAVIYNGVDLQEFAPPAVLCTQPLRPRVLHVGKGPVIIGAVQRAMGDFDFRHLNAGLGEEADRFRTGDLFLFPSPSEGDAYALIEALACGLPVVASAVGRLEGMEGEQEFGEVLEPKAGPREYAEALRRVWRRRENYAAGARRYAIAHADAERWAREWRVYLGMEVG